DMNLQGGLGDVTVKNVNFNLPACEKVTAVKHKNGSDVWVITHAFGVNAFFVYPITCSGLLSFPSVYITGSSIVTAPNTRGYMKVSPDGKKLVMANAGSSIELFDFDIGTGVISNPKTITSATSPCGPYGAEFSPDSRLLYVTESCNPPAAYSILQYDLTASDVTASRVVLNTGASNAAGALQLGPDNKIYVAFDDAGFLGAILSPNTAGTGCNFQKQFVNLPGPAKSGMGLPSSLSGSKRTLLGDDTTFCDGASRTIKINMPNTTYKWQNGSVADSFIVSTPGKYWVELDQYFNGNHCIIKDTVTVNFARTPTFSLGKDTTVCANTLDFPLNAPIAGAAYLWQDSTTGSSLAVKAPGLYWLQTSLNGCSFRDSVVVSSSPLPTFSLGPDTTICGNQPLVIGTSLPGASYLWSTGSTANSISVNTTGLYWLQTSTSTGCSFRDTLNLAFNPIPAVILGNDTTVCALPLTIGSTIPGATYRWQDGSTNATLSVAQPGLYWVEVSFNGCTRRDSVNITGNPVTAFALGRDTALCNGQPLALNGPANVSGYLWSTGQTSQNINITAAGTYWLKITNASGCSYSDTIDVRVNSTTVVNLGNDTAVCRLPFTIGQSIPGASYLWQDGSTSAFFSAGAAGLYWVQVTVNGCSARDSIRIQADPASGFNLGRDTIVCSGQPLNLQVSPGYQKYLWSTGSTANTITAISSGLYWLEAVNNAGCTFRDTINVIFNTQLYVDLGRDTIVCRLPLTIGHSVPNASYLWSDGTTGSTLSVQQPGLYWLQTSSNGCTGRDSINISLDRATAINLGNDVVSCSSQPITLDAGANYQRYLWSTGSTAKSISVTTSGIYWLEANNQSGCIFRDTINITLTPSPVFSLGKDTTLCQNEVLELDVSNTTGSYIWQDQSTQPRFQVNKPGVYHVSVVNNGCTRSDTIAVTYKSLPAPDLGADQMFCPGEQLILNPKSLGTSYTWQDGSRTPTYKVTQPGKYSVRVQNECGVGTDEIVVTAGACSLQFPNAFTPGKRPNETFKLINGSGVKDFRLQVFNRWGQNVYQSANAAEGWDGKYKGLEQPSGMYIFVTSYVDENGKQFTQKGTVVLIR
ncbi:MAG TPA: gliding motility-associated C-terminal domain-containing protein, partial [Chitinophagaceae bacterium]|nr:gliding motility-associated C-terminal domain-containing protein [Chitinophagaceae bacterium]